MKNFPVRALLSLGVIVVIAACVTQQPATDLANTITGPTAVSTAPTTPTATTPAPAPAPTTPAPTTPAAVAYVQDMQPIFQADCVRCHSGSRPSGNYSMSTYAQVMRAVTAGNARSALVVTTQRGSSMYRYWSGNAVNKADLVRRWVVENGAAQQR